MSEEACAYYLRSDRIEDAFELLKRWNRRGFAYPPRDGWVTLVVAETEFEYPWVAPGNRGLLLRFEPMTTYGWHFDIWKGIEQIGSYGRWWIQKKIDVEPADLVDRLVTLFPYLGHRRDELAALLRLDGGTCDLKGPETVRRFAELLKLFYFNGISYGLLDKFPQDAVDSGRWLAYDPLIGVPIDAAGPRINRLTGVDLVAPRILYATRDDAKREWLKITRKVWKGAAWADVLRDVEMVRLGDMGDEICLSCMRSRSMHFNLKMWRLHLVGDCIFELREHYRTKLQRPRAEVDEAADRCSNLSGAPFWFEVGMMNSVYDLVPPDEIMRRTPCRQYLERFVAHLPELIRHQTSFYRFFSGLPEWAWAFRLEQLARSSGWQLPEQDFRERTPTEILEPLFDHGVIVREGARYRLNSGP